MDIKSWNGRIYVSSGSEETEYESLEAMRDELERMGTPEQLKQRLALWEWLASKPVIAKAEKAADRKLETQLILSADVKVINAEVKADEIITAEVIAEGQVKDG